MKFFVSSRIKELLVERKAAIEAIHFSGHTPLYIETEPIVKDEQARDTMNKLVSDADAFISIYYLSEGRRETILDDHTPIEYELLRFLDQHKDAPILFFRQLPDEFVNPSHSMVRWFEEKAIKLGIKIINFEGPDQLDSKIRESLLSYSDKKDFVSPTSRVIVRYVGSDYIGLIAKASEVIFTKHKLNIDYISHASGGGRGALYVSCSARELPGSSEQVDTAVLKEDLRYTLIEDLKSAKDDGRLVDGSDINITPEIVVDIDTTKPKPFQFFVEARTIDAPGQLNAICKVLREQHFNIDELHLRPTPPEYRRQTIIFMWLSKSFDLLKDPDKELGDLEASLRYLVGIRACSIKVV